MAQLILEARIIFIYLISFFFYIGVALCGALCHNEHISQGDKEMTTSSLVAQARKMNHAAIQARKAGNMATAAFCRELRQINMLHAGMAWMQGR